MGAMDGRRCFALLLALAALALAGCGSTTVHHVTTTITRSASASSSTTSRSTTANSTTTTSAKTTATAAAGRPLAGHSPRQVIDLAAAALRHAGGYAMRADLLQSHTRTIIDLSANADSRYEATLTSAGATYSVISVPGAAYLRGDAAFWRAQAKGNAALARRLRGHWLHVPDSGAHSVTKSLGTLTPGTLARCLTEDHGTLTLAGHTTVAGRRALVVRDAGNAPGATPSTITVAATGTPYPLRYDATGATRRGGRVDVCNDGKGDGATGTIALSQFGHTPAVSAPVTAGSYGGGSPT